jgi:hypothetical protein
MDPENTLTREEEKQVEESIQEYKKGKAFSLDVIKKDRYG